MPKLKEVLCEHNNSSLEFVKMIEYECEGEIKIKIKDVCNNCQKIIGHEVHVFKFSHIEEGGAMIR